MYVLLTPPDPIRPVNASNFRQIFVWSWDLEFGALKNDNFPTT